MVHFIWLGVGFCIGGAAAAIRPKEVQSALCAAEDLKVERALLAAAVVGISPGPARELLLALPTRVT